MTQEQVIAAIKKLKAYYPYFYNNITKEDAKAIVEVWLEHFSELDNNYMVKAINSWGIKNDKPPSVAELRKNIGSFYNEVDTIYSKGNLTKEEKKQIGVQRDLLWKYLTGQF